VTGANTDRGKHKWAEPFLTLPILVATKDQSRLE
jgi:hypothetical protein